MNKLRKIKVNSTKNNVDVFFLKNKPSKGHWHLTEFPGGLILVRYMFKNINNFKKCIVIRSDDYIGN